jgi:Domain of unknown function (DUF1772)
MMNPTKATKQTQFAWEFLHLWRRLRFQVLARYANDDGNLFSLSYRPAALVFIAALVFTLVFNVPINLATGRWDPEDPPLDWQQTRNRWEFFQGVRSWLLLIGFILLCLAVALPQRPV